MCPLLLCSGNGKVGGLRSGVPTVFGHKAIIAMNLGRVLAAAKGYMQSSECSSCSIVQLGKAHIGKVSILLHTPRPLKVACPPVRGQATYFFLLAGHPGRTGRVFFFCWPEGTPGHVIFFQPTGQADLSFFVWPARGFRTCDYFPARCSVPDRRLFFLPARAPPDRRLPTSRPACPRETPF